MTDFSRKAYDPDLDEASSPAEEAVEAYLKRDPLISSVVRFPFGHKDIDLVYELDGVLWGVEVECRAKWWPATDQEFTWHPIRVPLRKLRLAQRYGHKLYYYGVRADLKRAYTFTGDRIVAGEQTKIGPHAMGDQDEGFVLIDGEVDYVDL
jgi:hypothetical protein